MVLSAVLSLAASLAVSVPDPRDSLTLSAVHARGAETASWTAASTGCACWWDPADTSCACCANNGCQCGCKTCGATAKQVCAQCDDFASCRQTADDLVFSRLDKKFSNITRLNKMSSNDQEPANGTFNASAQDRAAEIIKDMFDHPLTSEAAAEAAAAEKASAAAKAGEAEEEAGVAEAEAEAEEAEAEAAEAEAQAEAAEAEAQAEEAEAEAKAEEAEAETKAEEAEAEAEADEAEADEADDVSVANDTQASRVPSPQQASDDTAAADDVPTTVGSESAGVPSQQQPSDDTPAADDAAASDDSQSLQASPDTPIMKWFYCMEDNVGDVLNKDLAQCVSNHTKSERARTLGFSTGIDFEPTMIPDIEGKVLGVGSVLEMALQKNDLVLGAGTLHACDADKVEGETDSDTYKIPDDVMSTVTFAATRGQLSAHCTNIVDAGHQLKTGDPALFLPYMCPAWSHLLDIDTTGRQKTCLLPHQEERSLLDAYEDAKAQGEAEKYLLLDTQTHDALGFVEKLTTECKRVVSASLHGVILSDAMQIPSMRWMNPKSLCNGVPTYAEGTDAANQSNPLRPERMVLCSSDEPHSNSVSSFKFDDYFSGIGWTTNPKQEEIASLDAISDEEVCCGPRISRDAIKAKAAPWLDNVMLQLKNHVLSGLLQKAARSSSAADATSFTRKPSAVDSTVTASGAAANQTGAVADADDDDWHQLLSSEAGREAQAAAGRAVAEMMKAASDEAAKALAADDKEAADALAADDQDEARVMAADEQEATKAKVEMDADAQEGAKAVAAAGHDAQKRLNDADQVAAKAASGGGKVPF